MAEKRGKGRPPGSKIAEREVLLFDEEEPDPVSSEAQAARMRLRERWELASVLNFLHVFEAVIQSNLKISAEEIEAALITPNDALARIHIALLKGLPPVNKNMAQNDAWVTVVCKKLLSWWPWVAEGENPLKPDHGQEIIRYKELDPKIRLMILKALCEVRADQDDVLSYITDALKNGTSVASFRKERIGGDANGISYWYDGDDVIGHRLYKEVIKVETKPKAKGKGSSAQPKTAFQWETLATNLDEFREVSESLSCGNGQVGATVGETIKTEVMPVLEELQKKKQRALKRRQREALLLDGLLHSNGIGIRCSRRDRRPVNYTFDEYDRAIDEAIQISKKSMPDGLGEVNHERVMGGSSVKMVKDGALEDEDNSIPDEDDRSQPENDDDDDDDDDYHEGTIGGEDNDEENETGKGGDDPDVQNGSDYNENNYVADSEMEEEEKNIKTRVVVHLRRSGRTTGNHPNGNFDGHNAGAAGHVEMKKRLRQRLTHNSGCELNTVSESDDDKLLEIQSGRSSLR